MLGHAFPVFGSRRATFSLEARLARHAARGERQHLEPGLGDRVAAVRAHPVAARIDVLEGTVDLLELSCPALHDGRGDLVVVSERCAAVRVLEHLPTLIGVPGRVHARVNGAAERPALPLQISLDGSHPGLSSCWDLPASDTALAVPTSGRAAACSP